MYECEVKCVGYTIVRMRWKFHERGEDFLNVGMKLANVQIEKKNIKQIKTVICFAKSKQENVDFNLNEKCELN